ncbi:electron transfer flavoprotein beta subunit lysine methyltransferase-like [Linepithema humile]|uniref:electron transfer flavoprotein beta subunit lysine methyltransferase-like n=1 Tax=Linepithema humile TaxID=83485 RepID=UPI00062301F2|nr:PREDICTED: protein N-lysine methyltransferase METTL20-like isoform X1 [Linepithema humile]XP_012227511.1 PREDICTED: protein N-lysine methyltransferase METTL20-like isoform X1 [Linepithema humile]XP_012227512.1 PREDICTED: protein N-lysine methyltransferase METTL20-like isoform X1 [Linepithema humile]XP_012227513.1 PREDICTED: protein N-lysine methyltransferase METTL20-like isoform X1 [Linepithema humile]XP_012227514.1 PREDICTED: protein N-lysine methyltransferase METTL20-like isoform X1 [Linep
MIVGRIICLKKQFFARKFSKSTKEAWDSFLRSSPRASLRRFLENHDDVANEILQNTEITRNHLTPELKLFLLTQNCSLYHKPVISEHEDGKFSSLTKNVFQDPYWSIYWPGGQALTRFIFDEREKILKTMSNSRKDTLRILDLGAGCGAAAIAAKLTIGTCEIIANDISRVACVAIAMNAILNHVDIEVSWKNLLEKFPEDLYDVIFVGDLLYDEEIANALIAWLEHTYARGARIYLGDPGRYGLTEDLRKRLRLLRRYSLPQNVKKENCDYDTAVVWEFVGL